MREDTHQTIPLPVAQRPDEAGDGRSASATAALSATPATGLTEAEARRRRDAGQGNVIVSKSTRTYKQILRENVFNFINDVLFTLGTCSSSWAAGWTPSSRSGSSSSTRSSAWPRRSAPRSSWTASPSSRGPRRP